MQITVVTGQSIYSRNDQYVDMPDNMRKVFAGKGFPLSYAVKTKILKFQKKNQISTTLHSPEVS